MNNRFIQSHVLSLKNISHTYFQKSNQIRVLNNINLDISLGEIIALTGPSGTGKSTLLNIAGLLETPTLGSINLCDTDCRLINEDQKTILRGKNIGFIFQSHRLFPEFSSLENVMLPQLLMGLSKKQALSNSKELLSTLGLEDRFLFRPANLSGGEAQRVAIARALANSPNLILADEPTGNLDPETAKKVFELLYKLVRALNISCLVATHNVDLANSMDRRISLKYGSIIS
jgi:lipoprotein-releasing system ATP-binding protein